MAALATPLTPWIPEDDLLLKNAVEAGASLEALAKGAVRFSRKFSVPELRDRWRSLLYDSDVAVEASSRMVRLQFSSDYSFPNSDFPARFLNYGGGSSISYAGGCGFGSGDGMVESAAGSSVKRKAESVRRVYRCMRKRLRSADAGFRPFGGDCGFGVDGFEYGANECCNLNSLCGVPIDLCCSRDVEGSDVVVDYGENVGGSDAGLFECDFANITDALMNFDSGDDGLDFIDGDGEDALDYDSRNLLVAAPDDLRVDRVPTVTELQELVSDEGLQTAIGSGLEIESKDFVSADGSDKSSLTCLEANFTSSEGAISTSMVENGSEEMECILNTEDPEIPCNDYFVLLNQRRRKDEYNHPQCPSTSLMIEAGALPINNSRHQLVGTKSMNGSLSVKSPTRITKQGGRFPGDLTQASNIEPSLSVVGGPNNVAIGALNPSDEALNSEISPTMGDIVIPDVDPPKLDQYESESDDDIPSFSDVEAMILDADLCPDDLNSVDMEAVRYQSQDSKRKVMRLEQCARSCMQRRIVSHDAFAVLYGHRLKHYIKQTEVILGRAADDMDVDIDLAREGPANKISRRQALIKMEADGSFLLKNLGKSSMFVNGKEVVTRQSMNLTSNSLIEIRGMAFVFEANNKCVRFHDVAKKHK